MEKSSFEVVGSMYCHSYMTLDDLIIDEIVGVGERMQ